MLGGGDHRRIGSIHWSITIRLHQLDHAVHCSAREIMEEQPPGGTQPPEGCLGREATSPEHEVHGLSETGPGRDERARWQTSCRRDADRMVWIVPIHERNQWTCIR